MMLALLVCEKNAPLIKKLSGIEIVPEVDEENVKYLIWSDDEDYVPSIIRRDALFETFKMQILELPIYPVILK